MRKLRSDRPEPLQIEFCGREQVTVEDPKKVVIAEYDTETIKLSMGEQKVRFYGVGLNLKNLTSRSVMISGKITSLEFEE